MKIERKIIATIELTGQELEDLYAILRHVIYTEEFLLKSINETNFKYPQDVVNKCAEDAIKFKDQFV